MSNTTTKKAVKKALIGAAVLAASPIAKAAGGGLAQGGKSQLGVNHLSLEAYPGRNAIMCISDEHIATMTGSNETPNMISIAVDPWKATIELVFEVRDIMAHDVAHTLFLVVNSQIMPEGSPALPTDKSINELRLVMAGIEILAMYEIPAQKMLAQDETRLGMANPAPHSTLRFSVNLGTGVLTRYMDGNEKTYVQAALIPSVQFAEERWDNMILSELNTVGFVKDKCPETDPDTGAPTDYVQVAVDSGGTMTVSDKAGNVTKTMMTGSMSMGATVITK